MKRIFVLSTSILLYLLSPILLGSLFTADAAAVASPPETATPFGFSPKVSGTGIRLGTKNPIIEESILKRAPEMVQGHPRTPVPARPSVSPDLILFIILFVFVIVIIVLLRRKKRSS